jgi:hypothetical protein
MNENGIYLGHAVSWIGLLKRNYLHPNGVFFVWSSSVEIFSISFSPFFIFLYTLSRNSSIITFIWSRKLLPPSIWPHSEGTRKEIYNNNFTSLFLLRTFVRNIMRQ